MLKKVGKIVLIILAILVVLFASFITYQRHQQRQYLENLEKLSTEELEKLVFKNYPYLEKIPPSDKLPEVPGPIYLWKCGDEEYYDYNYYSARVVNEDLEKSTTGGLTEDFDVLWRRFLLEKVKNKDQFVVIPEHYQPIENSCKNNPWEKNLVTF